MPRAIKFRVNPQIPQENQNPNSYSTGPAFFMPGSSADTFYSRRKKTTVKPLSESNAWPDGTSSHCNGPITPQTPSMNFTEPVVLDIALTSALPSSAKHFDDDFLSRFSAMQYS